MWLVMTTGMRRGELLSLRWANIDLDKATLDIRHTKTHRMRVISLDKGTVEVMKEHRQRYESAVQQLGVEPRQAGVRVLRRASQ